MEQAQAVQVQIYSFVLFLIVFIPGFISMKVYDLIMPGARRDFSKALYEAIGFSSLNFAALSWLIIPIHAGEFYLNHRVWYLILVFFIIFVMPLIWPLLLVRLWTWRPIAALILNPVPKPWDYVFRKRQAYWMTVHLKDKRRIGGRYGLNSAASSYPAQEQIYLEELWELDESGKFIKAVDGSQGAIILGKDILAVELFE